MSNEKKHFIKVSALVAANFAVGMTLYSDLAIADYSLPYATPTMINAFGYCYVVTNTSGSTAFVPVSNASEWTNIINNHGGLSFGSCGNNQGDGGCGYCGDGGDGWGGGFGG